MKNIFFSFLFDPVFEAEKKKKSASELMNHQEEDPQQKKNGMQTCEKKKRRSKMAANGRRSVDLQPDGQYSSTTTTAATTTTTTKRKLKKEKKKKEKEKKKKKKTERRLRSSAVASLNPFTSTPLEQQRNNRPSRPTAATGPWMTSELMIDGIDDVIKFDGFANSRPNGARFDILRLSTSVLIHSPILKDFQCCQVDWVLPGFITVFDSFLFGCTWFLKAFTHFLWGLVDF